VQTASGATAVQVVYSKRRGARRMEHIGSAHDEQEVEALKAAARQRLAGGQQLDLGVDTDDAALAGPGPLPIVASRRGHPVGRAVPGLRPARVRPGHRWDEVFRQLVLARIIEPEGTSRDGQSAEPVDQRAGPVGDTGGRVGPVPELLGPDHHLHTGHAVTPM
jgi:hypothetical protein